MFCMWVADTAGRKSGIQVQIWARVNNSAQ